MAVEDRARTSPLPAVRKAPTSDPKGVIDKLNPRLMKNQVDIATKMVVLMDRLTAAQLKGTAPISEADLFGG